MKKEWIFAVAFVLAGCATAAQRQSQQMGTTARAAITELKTCMLTVRDSPAYRPLLGRIPPDLRDATLGQMTNAAMVSDEEKQAIYVSHSRLQECRKFYLQQMAMIAPSITAIQADAWQKADESLIDLLQQKITWGEHVKRLRAIAAEDARQLTQATQEITANLQRSHEAELARRQSAANATAQYFQTQQFINSMNRPVMTHCSALGSSVNCASY